MTDADMTEEEWLTKIVKSLQRDDVQEFEQVHNLGGVQTKVWYRPLSGDFMADTFAQRDGARGWKRLTATADGRAECLEALAARVADYLFPVKEVRHD